jgi:DNA excision repair protein ERCC-4
VQGSRLPAGDYVLLDRLVVERKGPTDLAASIKDRRMFEQLARLADAHPGRAGDGGVDRPPVPAGRQACVGAARHTACAPPDRRRSPDRGGRPPLPAGDSAVGAGRLLAHFGSLERVFAAREELLQVRGIGPVRARTLDRLFRTTAPSATGENLRSLAA